MIMNANGTRALAFNSAEEEIKKVKQEIQTAAEKKLMSVSVSNLSPATRESLIADGFRIEWTDYPVLTMYTISW
jgi:hypothetical protein